MSGSSLPRWDLSPIFPSLDSVEYGEAKARLEGLCLECENHVKTYRAESFDVAWLKAALNLLEGAFALFTTCNAYCYSLFSTNTKDEKASRELSDTERLLLPAKRAAVLFRSALKAEAPRVASLAQSDEGLKTYAFFMEEERTQAERQMAPELEDLQAELAQSGADAWGRLQESLASNLSAAWDGEGGGRKTLTELRNLAYHEDRDTRRRAYQKELELLDSASISFAAALNGVKGTNVVLDRRRGWKSALERAAFQARIRPETLQALIGALENSLPLFRDYLKRKASLLGLERLSFYDLFAPLPGALKKYTYGEMRDFIVDAVGPFDPNYARFVERAFSENWIDAEPREGKVGGAYCVDFPNALVSRVLFNYEDSFNGLITLAHELGHAYHHECVKDLPFLLTDYPMTLAETASIFSETLVFESALKRAQGAERMALLEFRLRDACQVIVDILSRFYFERESFERRAAGELSADEFSELMLRAQKATYGDAIKGDELHKYMWAVKGHYYYADLSFYNFPYAFGQLFGLGLYARYEAEGPSFAAEYREILRRTGGASCEEVAKAAGADITKRDFWERGLSVFAGNIKEFAGN
jgi:pepF/M3 family oligoendopeptidase